MKCDYCKKGRPTLWNSDGKFCDNQCYVKWLELKIRKKWKDLELNEQDELIDWNHTDTHRQHIK